MCLENNTPFLKYRPPGYNSEFYVTGYTSYSTALEWPYGPPSCYLMGIGGPNATTAHHSIRLNSTLLQS